MTIQLFDINEQKQFAEDLAKWQDRMYSSPGDAPVKWIEPPSPPKPMFGSDGDDQRFAPAEPRQIQPERGAALTAKDPKGYGSPDAGLGSQQLKSFTFKK